MKHKDIYTEAPANPDTFSMLGPIAPLAGKWFGDDGVDTHPQAGGPETEPYVETWDFEVMDPQNNGPQVLYGLRYHVHITKPGELAAFHDQVGYLLYEPETRRIYMTLAIPRGQIAMAEGTAEPGAREIRLHAERGQTVNGICSNPLKRPSSRNPGISFSSSMRTDASATSRSPSSRFRASRASSSIRTPTRCA